MSKQVLLETVDMRNLRVRRQLAIYRRLAIRALGGRCKGCGANDGLEIDHIISVSNGGSDADENLQLLCGRCHKRKHHPDSLKKPSSAVIPPLKWICPSCGKKIESLYRVQFENNVNLHKGTHKR